MNQTFTSSSSWKTLVSHYEQPDFWLATWQIVNSIGAYVAIWCLIYFSQSISSWLMFGLMILGAGLLIRVFIIFHDCVHDSFFESKRANKFWGTLAGVLTFTPYVHWRDSHLHHHVTSGNLKRRGRGDIWTLTVTEYLQSSKSQKFLYRLVRHPLILFVVGPALQFLILQRFPQKGMSREEKKSIWMMNAGIVGLAMVLIAIFGVSLWAITQLTILAVSSSVGVWMFYVQHQFEDAYWEQDENWDYVDAALRGSSFYKLPFILQWFTGNIGFHHIHHLSPRVPNYHLEKCHYSAHEFSTVKTLTLFKSLKLMSLKLWDEDRKELISFSELRKNQRHSLLYDEGRATN